MYTPVYRLNEESFALVTGRNWNTVEMAHMKSLKFVFLPDLQVQTKKSKIHVIFRSIKRIF